jgi:hypothetical protein
MTNFDGKGDLTQVDHVLVSGVTPPVEWTAGTGTDSVNQDCTGTAVINVPGNPFSPVKLHFVVVRQGKEIHTVVEANAVTGVETLENKSIRWLSLPKPVVSRSRPGCSGFSLCETINILLSGIPERVHRQIAQVKPDDHRYAWHLGAPAPAPTRNDPL